MEHIPRPFMKIVWRLPVLAAVVLVLAGLARADAIWDGGGGASAGWGNAQNWGGDVLPSFDGLDDIHIKTIAPTGQMMSLGGDRNINSLTIETTTRMKVDSGGVLTIRGGRITRVNVVGTEQDHSIACGICLGAGGIIDNPATGSALNLIGPISASGPNTGATFTGNGVTRLQGPDSNVYTGTTTISGGTLVLDKSAGALAILGNVVVGDGAGTDTLLWNASNQILPSAVVTVGSSGLMNLQGNNQAVSGLVISGRGGGLDSVATENGTLTLLGDVTAPVSAYEPRISGGLDLGGADRTFQGQLEVEAVISGTGGLVKAGSGRLRLTAANSYTGTTVVAGGIGNVVEIAGSIAGNAEVIGGTLNVTGSVGGTVYVRGGTLCGAGTVGGIEVVSGTVDVGNSIGIASVAGGAAFSAGSVLCIQVRGAADGVNVAGRDYDRLAIGGAATGLDACRMRIEFDLAGGVDPASELQGMDIVTAGCDMSGLTFSNVELADSWSTAAVHPWRATIVGGVGYVRLTDIRFVARGGDANLDGAIDLSDLGILAGNYGHNGCGWHQGDYNFDGVVDLSDLGILAGNYGRTYSADSGVTTVPEPGVVALLVAGVLLRRRKQRFQI